MSTLTAEPIDYDEFEVLLRLAERAKTNRQRRTSRSGRKKALSMVRVSTNKQADKDFNPLGFSLETQRELNTKKADDLNADVVGEFVSRGESGRNIDRKEIRHLMQTLRAHGGDIDYVIVPYIDRIARNVDHHVMLRMLIEAAGASLKSATEPIDDSPIGRGMELFLAWQADFQSSHNVGKIKTNLLRKVEVGGTPGKAPIGYKNVTIMFDGRKVNTVAVDEDAAPHVRWAFTVYATGDWSIARLTDALDSRGLRTLPTAKRKPRPLTRSAVAKMLANPYYYGVIVFNGVHHQGRHEPLISRDLFDKVQDALRANANGEKERIHTSYLKSTLYCGYCGARMCVSLSRGKGGEYLYWFCLGHQRDPRACPQGYRPDERLEGNTVGWWRDVRLTEQRIEELKAGLVATLDQARAGRDEQITALRRQIGRLRAQEKELLDLRYAEQISRELFAAEQRRVMDGIADAERDIRQLELIGGDHEALLDKATEMLRVFPEVYRLVSEHLRRQMNRVLFEALYVQGDEIVGARLTPIASVLFHDDLKRTWGHVPTPPDHDPKPGRGRSDEDQEHSTSDPLSGDRSSSIPTLVGMGRFELPASTSRTWRANQAALHPDDASWSLAGARSGRQRQ